MNMHAKSPADNSTHDALDVGGYRDPILDSINEGVFNRMHGRDLAGLSPEAFSLLMEHDFPGNVRELQNILEHAFVLCHNGLIEPSHLPPYLRRRRIAGTAILSNGMDLRAAEKILICEALSRHEGNRALAASEPGINPSTLYRKIKLLGIDVPGKDGRSKRS